MITHTKIKAENKKKVSEIKYRLPFFIGERCVRYRTYPVEDDDVRGIFHAHETFENVGVLELYADIEDYGLLEDDDFQPLYYVPTSYNVPLEEVPSQATTFHNSFVSPTIHTALELELNWICP